MLMIKVLIVLNTLDNLKDPKLEEIINILQQMSKDFEELELRMAARELENNND
jgi:hypothetical protein